MKKRGQGEVITTVLIILLVLAAVFILYVFVRNMIQSGINKADASPMDVSLLTSSTSLSNSMINVSVLREAGKGDVSAIKIIFTDSSGKIYTYENRSELPEELETKFYSVDLTGKISDVVSYKVYPMIKSGNKEIAGLEAIHTGLESRITIQADCGATNPCPSLGQCINNSCINGKCVASNKTTRILCNDGKSCTENDWCDSGVCVGVSITICVSGDGCCPDTCSYSGGDGDCNNNCKDDDHDGYNITGGNCGVIDCNDSNMNIHPGALEICNGIDDDCDSVIDEEYSNCNPGFACQGGACVYALIDIIPNMTSNTLPAGYIASADSADSSFPAYKAFDNNLSTSWWAASDEGTKSLYITLSGSAVVKGYGLKGNTGNEPKNWTLSCIDSSSIILDAKTGVTWTAGEFKRFRISTNTISCKKYKLATTLNNGGQLYNNLAEMELYDI